MKIVKRKVWKEAKVFIDGVPSVGKFLLCWRSVGICTACAARANEDDAPEMVLEESREISLYKRSYPKITYVCPKCGAKEVLRSLYPCPQTEESTK